MKNEFIMLEKKIGYSFKDLSLLKVALTHASVENEKKEVGQKVDSNQRLEFLGDAIFDAIIGEELYRMFPERDEGFLTKTRSRIVCENALEKIGKDMGIGDLVWLTKGEENSGGRKKKAIIADGMEAVIGAIFLDSNYENTRNIVLNIFKKTINDILQTQNENRDYKSSFQEKVQGNVKYKDKLFGEPITTNDIKYIVTKEDGPDHKKIFEVVLKIGDMVAGVGIGKSKKEAEQEAAKMALEER